MRRAYEPDSVGHVLAWLLVEVVGVIPYTIIVALVSAVLSASAATWVQGNAYKARIATLQQDFALAAAKSEADTRAAELSYNARYQEAVNAARSRETVLRRERDAARAESDGLREQSADAARRLSGAPPAAVLEYAATAGELLADCGRRYQELAGQADGHASDVATLIGAWPMNPSRPDAGHSTESNP